MQEHAAELRPSDLDLLVKACRNDLLRYGKALRMRDQVNKAMENQKTVRSIVMALSLCVCAYLVWILIPKGPTVLSISAPLLLL